VNRARANVELGHIEFAYTDLERALELDPANEMASSMIQNFNRDKKLM